VNGWTKQSVAFLTHRVIDRFVLFGWLLFCKDLFFGWGLVRSSLVFGLLARRTWPLALMVSTNQVPFRTSNSKRSGQSPGRLGFRADKIPSLHWSCKLLFLRWCVHPASPTAARDRLCGAICIPPTVAMNFPADRRRRPLQDPRNGAKRTLGCKSTRNLLPFDQA